MFKVTKKDRRKTIDRVIDEGLEQVEVCIDECGVASDSVTQAIGNVKELSEIKRSNKPKINEILKDILPTLITTIGSIACVWLIINYEQDNIITTKSFPFIPKGRA